MFSLISTKHATSSLPPVHRVASIMKETLAKKNESDTRTLNA